MTEVQAPPVPPPLLIAAPLRARINTNLHRETFEGGWLLTGPPSVGKAALANRLAKALLSRASGLEEEDEHTRRRIDHGGHPDYFLLKRQPKDPDKAPAKDKPQPLKSHILVDDIRTILEGLHRTSSTGRRVVIVDLADDMNRAAANALLKMLEEPPAGCSMLLLSAAPGRLLPTIRSRCRRLSVPPVSTPALARWLTDHHGMPEEDARRLAVLSGGRPGYALALSAPDARDAICDRRVFCTSRIDRQKRA